MATDPHQQYPAPHIGKIEELESLRGLAALLIVFFHIPRWHPILDIGIINNGYLMLELFFVLSGFVIYNAYSGKLNSMFDLMRFQFLRFGRLYPVHLLFLTAYFLIEVAKYIAEIKFGVSSPNTKPFRENNLTALVQQLFMVQAIGPTGNALTFNTPAWSISTEFFTYLLFGAILLWCRRARYAIFAAIVIISMVMLGTGETFGFKLLIRCFGGFFLGCLVAGFVKKISVNIPGYCSLLLMVLIVLFLQLKKEREYDMAVYFLTSLLLISLFSAKQGWANTLLKARPLVWLGTISYSLYMAHSIVIWAANQVCRVVLKKPEVVIDGRSYPQLSAAETVIAVAVTVLVVLLLAQIVHRLVEKPLRAQSRRIAFRKG